MKQTNVRLPGEPETVLNADSGQQPEKEAHPTKVAPDGKDVGSTDPTTPPAPDSPFRRADQRTGRIKAFIYGGTGVGKTLFCLGFPNPAYIDMERGTEAYQGEYRFDVQQSTSADSIMQTVDWLRTHRHGYTTLIIDPFTVFWEDLQRKWSDIFLRRNRGSKGYKHEFYDFQARDWMAIKSDLKAFMRKLLSLDMNVIVTARQKTKYAESGFMQAVGETYDSEKSLPYLFDIVLQFYRSEDGRYLARVIKDRTRKLPKEDFECTFEVFERLYGNGVFTAASSPVILASEEQKAKLRRYIEESGASPEAVRTRLADYDAGSIDELSSEAAEIIIEKFEAARTETIRVEHEA
jgi:hypothetical protein